MYDDIACRHCGVIGGHVVTLLAASPHYARLDCGHCGRWIKWLKNPNVSDAAREANRKAAIDEHMRSLDPTDKQIALIEKLGGDPYWCMNRLEASELIDQLLKGGR